MSEILGPVYGDQDVFTSDGEKINERDWRNYNIRNARGRFGGRVFFNSPRSVLKSGKGKPQQSAWFDFSTGRMQRSNAHRYISIHNKEDLSEMVFDL
jgi:hypothetical protein